MKICIKCGELKSNELFEKNRNTCKKCRSNADKERHRIAKEKDLVMYKCKEMAYSAHARVCAPSKKYKTCYQNLEQPFGFDTIKEFQFYLYDTFKLEIQKLLDKGLKPSVDRIDNKIGYTKDNVRILSFKTNTELGVNSRKRKVKMISPIGEIIIFESVTKLANYFGETNSHNMSKYSSWIKQNGIYKKPDGYHFEYIS